MKEIYDYQDLISDDISIDVTMQDFEDGVNYQQDYQQYEQQWYDDYQEDLHQDYQGEEQY